MTETDYTNLLPDYQDLKLKTHKQHNEIINTVRDWFEENHPIPGLSVYVNDRVIIDQICISSTHKISGEILKEFSEVFGLEMKSELYRVRREHRRTMIVGNPYVDFEKYRYSFTIKNEYGG